MGRPGMGMADTTLERVHFQVPGLKRKIKEQKEEEKGNEFYFLDALNRQEKGKRGLTQTPPQNTRSRLGSKEAR